MKKQQFFHIARYSNARKNLFKGITQNKKREKIEFHSINSKKSENTLRYLVIRQEISYHELRLECKYCGGLALYFRQKSFGYIHV